MRNNKFCSTLLCLIIPFIFLSCSYKESFKDKIFVDYYNYTNYDVEIQVTWSNNKVDNTLLQKKMQRSKTYRFWFNSRPNSGLVKLIYKGEPVESIELNFPGEGLYSYCAYGGLYTKINILLDENEVPYIKITDDAEMEV